MPGRDPALARASTSTGEADVTAIAPLRATLIVLALTVALLAPALWNGYPLLYFDTVDYVSLGFTWKLPIYRTAGYAFLGLAGWATGTVWAIVVLQALATAWVLFEAWRRLLPDFHGPRLLMLLLLGFLFTSLPWVTSLVMPDVFAAPAVLLVLMLALHQDTLDPLRKAAFIVLLAVSCAAHPTHVTMVAGLLACVAVLSWLARRGGPFVPMRASGIAMGLLLGVALSVAANWAVTGRAFLAPRTTPLLTFAVLFEHGLGERYLAETCDQPGVYQSVFCPYRDSLPTDANQLLWHDPSLWKAGGWEKVAPLASHDIEAILRRYPFEFALNSARLTVEQIAAVRTGEGFRTHFGFIDRQIQAFYPRDATAFAEARQQSYPEIWNSPIPALNLLHVPVALGGIFLLAGATVIAMRRRFRLEATMATLVLLACLGNAFICGAVSNPADRYGSRLAWLTTLVAAVVIARLRPPAAAGTSSAAG